MSEGRFDTERDVFSETLASSSKATMKADHAITIYWHLAISPDGKYILAFNRNTLQFKIIEMNRKDELPDEKPFQVDKKEFPNIENYKNQQFPLFKTALSNLDEHLGEQVIFVAISFIEKNDMLAKGNNESTNQENQQHGKTIIYRMVKEEEEPVNKYKQDVYQVYEEGGIISFAHSDTISKSNSLFTQESITSKVAKIQCFLFNANGIFRYTYSSKYPFSTRYKKQHFFYPKRLEDELIKLYSTNPCLERIESCIFDHYFVIEQYNEGIQSIQLFNLITMEMEQIFQERLDKHLYKKFSRPIFSISRNKFLLMFSKGVDSILIFYIENSLEIARKDFGNDVKIMFCEFIKEDEALLLIIKKPKTRFPTIVIWDLFSTDKNSIQHHKGDKDFIVKDNTETKPYNARCPGNLLTIDAKGVVFSIFELWSSKEVETPQAAFHCKLIPSVERISYIMPKIQAKKNPAHMIYRRKRDPKISDKPLVNNKEPWVEDYNYERISAYLDEEETTQLIIGRTTVQIWQGNSENLFLEYIWSNNTKPGDNDKEASLIIKELHVGDRNFYLKVTWTHNNSEEIAEIKWPYPDGHVTAVRHACEALAHFNYRKYKLVGYKKHHKFDKIINNISLIIWRFIKKRPDVWKLMDVRYDVIKNIIIGGSTFLVKYILFGEKDLHLHIPQLEKWEDHMIDVKEEKYREQSMENIQEKEDKEQEEFMDLTRLTDLQTAIRFCSKDRRIDRHVVIVGYLLEYYTNNAVNNIGWLITFSKALPDLYKHKLLVYYAKEIFYKECFLGLEMSYNIDYRDVIPYEIEQKRQKTQSFIAFSPNRKLVANEIDNPFTLKYLRKLYTMIYTTIYQQIFPNPFRKTPPAIRIIPLYGFATSTIVEKQLQDQKTHQKSFFWKLFSLLFIPRGYLSKSFSGLSPFVQIIRTEKDNDIYNNPTMEAAINYRWVPARNYFLQIYLFFILYATCFAVICGFYLSHAELTGNLNNFLFILMIYFYYLGSFLLFVEYRQLEHLGWKEYLQFFNFFDLAAIISPLVVMAVFIASSFKFSNGFADVVTTQNITVVISFTMLLLWFEFILYLRLISEPAKYIYIILNILKKSYVFLLFIFLVLVAFAHSMFILLQHPTFTNVNPRYSTYNVKNSTTNKPIDVNVKSDFDPNSRLDNPNSNFGDSLISSYFWMGGDYVQDETWDFWAVDILTLLASILVVTILQNMFIAFMGGIYSGADTQANKALLSFRAESISDYEALDGIHFLPLDPDPKYIFYLGRPSCIKTWKEICGERKDFKLYSRYEEKIAEIEDVFVEKNLKVKNSLWDWDGDKEEFNYYQIHY